MTDIYFLDFGVLSTLIMIALLYFYKDRGGLIIKRNNAKANILIVFIIVISLVELGYIYFYTNDGDTERDSYLQAYPRVSSIAVFSLICIITPIFEEILFRGHLYNLAIKFKIPISIWFVFTTILWISTHDNLFISEMIIFFIWGYMLAYLRHVSQSIIPNIIIHIAHNCLVWFQPASF